ncbi:MAG: hypothetical protein IIA61_10925 [Candidatus Marinimicrobia bacterium]|nr:hypothetical protein [Candidatus Neomarinimicrobiota bacterium]
MVNSIIWGVSIPLVVNVATFLIIRKFVGRKPEDALKANTIGFLSRIFLYAIVIVIVASTIELDLTPFILSFILIFIFLILMEALYLRRLFYKTNE